MATLLSTEVSSVVKADGRLHRANRKRFKVQRQFDTLEETAMLSSPALGSRKKCGVDGCAKFAQTGGVCKKHGASKNVNTIILNFSLQSVHHAMYLLLTAPKPYYSPPANNYYPPSAPTPTPYYYYPAAPEFVETCCSTR
eukprot:scaffold7951_cov80-Skeletonema_marinoi.AAC.3